MKQTKTAERSEKTGILAYFRAMKGVQIPWVLLVLIFAASMGSTYAGMNISFFTGDMVDARGNVPTQQLVNYGLSYVGLGLAAAAGYVFTAIAAEKINLGIRTKLWRKIMYTKQSCYDADGGEALVSRVTTDCDFASKLITTIVSMLSLFVSLGIYISRMYQINATISSAMLLLIPVSVLTGWLYARLKFLIARKNQAMLSRTTTYLVERTKSLSLIKTANAQNAEIANGRENFREQYHMQIKSGLMNVFYSALQTGVNILSILIPFVVGAKLVSAGVLKVGMVIAFYTIATTVGVEVTNVIDSVGTIRQANGAMSRVISALELPDEEAAAGMTMDVPDQDIRFEEVDFRYGEKEVLHKITCTVPRNKITAVVGTNGSGKSTLFKLIERLYDPCTGRMCFGDTDAKEFDLHAWRKAFCLVAQGAPLMEGTVRENICYGCQRPVTEEELVRVAKQARVYDFVSQLPEGFETLVAPGGTNFSGGQRQCIAIARAMMNNPDYLLLDEATCSLDAASERLVMEALEELMEGRTTVIIAHSLATIRKADHVIVLRDGAVEDSGAPAKILRSANNYLSKVMGRRANA